MRWEGDRLTRVDGVAADHAEVEICGAGAPHARHDASVSCIGKPQDGQFIATLVVEIVNLTQEVDSWNREPHGQRPRERNATTANWSRWRPVIDLFHRPRRRGCRRRSYRWLADAAHAGARRPTRGRSDDVDRHPRLLTGQRCLVMPQRCRRLTRPTPPRHPSCTGPSPTTAWIRARTGGMVERLQNVSMTGVDSRGLRRTAVDYRDELK